MELIQGIRSRRSVREFKPEPVPDKTIMRVLEAAIWAPSAHNAQPWRFVIIRDPNARRSLADAMGKAWRIDLARDGVPPEIQLKMVEGSLERLTSCPTIIVPCLTMEGMQSYPDERRLRAEYTMAVQSVAAAVENMLLAAHAEGLGGCWLCAPLFCQDVVREVLKMPSHIDPQAIILMGYPDEEPKPPPRLPFEKVVYFELWK